MNNKPHKLKSAFQKCLQKSYKDQAFLKSLKITFDGANLVVIRWVDGPTVHEIKRTTENLCEKNKLLIICNRSYSNKVMQEYWESFSSIQNLNPDLTIDDFVFAYDDFGFKIIKSYLKNINLSTGG